MPLKRLIVVTWLVLLVACGTAAAASPSRAELRGLLCRRAAVPAGRMVSVTALMRPVPGTVRMALKFELVRRTARGGGFRPVFGRQLGQWISPGNPTLGQDPADVWMLKQNVVNLVAPAAYRFRVWFRWTGAGGRVLGIAARLSPPCSQPDVRADLVVRSIAVKPLGNGQDEYEAVIRNAGGVASGAFAVELDPPGAPSQSVVSQSLEPGVSEREVFTAPACASGADVTVVADPGQKVADSARGNNTLTTGCSGA